MSPIQRVATEDKFQRIAQNDTPLKMKIFKKILLALPLVAQLATLGWFVWATHVVLSLESGDGLMGFVLSLLLWLVVILQNVPVLFAVAFASTVGAVIYLQHVMKNAQLAEDERTTWIISFFLTGIFGQATYYFARIVAVRRVA